MLLTWNNTLTYDTWCQCTCACQDRELITLEGLTRSAAAATCVGTDTFIFTHRNGQETDETCPGAHSGSGPDLPAAVIAEAQAQPWDSGPGQSLHRVEANYAEYSEGQFRLVLSVPILKAPPVEATISGGWENWRGVPFAESKIAEGRALLTWAEDAFERRIFRSDWLPVQTATTPGHWSFIELVSPRGICLDHWG